MGKRISVGMDRFLDLKWVDYGLDLAILSKESDGYAQLRDRLALEISGYESARKTANQIRRLWLVEDNISWIREIVFQEDLLTHYQYRPILHYGMSLIIFPLFTQVCQYLGSLFQTSETCTRSQIQHRVLLTYPNSQSSLRSTDRVLQTLINWGFIQYKDGHYSQIPIKVDDQEIAEWLLIVIVHLMPFQWCYLRDLHNKPELLGIKISNLRMIIQRSKYLRIQQDAGNMEIVSYQPVTEKMAGG